MKNKMICLISPEFAVKICVNSSSFKRTESDITWKQAENLIVENISFHQFLFLTK